MLKPIQTPYGHFPSQIQAARYIVAEGFKPAFDSAFPHDLWRRTNHGARYAEQNLPKEVQDVCDVLRLLVRASVAGWRDA